VLVGAISLAVAAMSAYAQRAVRANTARMEHEFTPAVIPEESTAAPEQPPSVPAQSPHVVEPKLNEPFGPVPGDDEDEYLKQQPKGRR